MARIDWSFTEDGDLALGSPRVNEDGEVLYKHLNNQMNTEIGENGRVVRDLELVHDLEAEKQIILNRLRTDTPDWYHHPGMGGNLSDLVGEPNTRNTGLTGTRFIETALTYEGMYRLSDINVRAVPISQDTLLFMIDIAKRSEVVRLPISFNLEDGVLDYYEVPASD